MIPHSCLAKELIEKFVETPQQAFDENGEPNPDWDTAPDSVKKQREYSCTFKSNLEGAKDNKSNSTNQQMKNLVHDEAIIRRQQELYKIDINQENQNQVMELLLRDSTPKNIQNEHLLWSIWSILSN